MQSLQNNVRDNCFDAIRYILAIVIVISHYSALSGDEMWLGVNVIGERVSIFFAISGYFSVMMYLKNPNPKDFAIRRLKRLLPAYWLTIIVSALVLSLFSELDMSDYFCSSQLYSYVCYNMLFANFMEPCLPGVFLHNELSAVNGALWTMKVEFMLLFTVPLFYLAQKRFGICKSLIAILLFSTAYRIVFDYLHDCTHNNIYSILGRQVGGQLVFFYSGAAVFLFQKTVFAKLPILLPISLLLYIFQSKLTGLEYFVPLAIAICTISVAYHFKFLNIANRFPNISYSMYLVHFPVIQLFVSLDKHREWGGLALLVCVGVTICLGYALWYIAERPFMRKSKQRSGS